MLLGLGVGSLNRFWNIKEISGDIGKTRMVPEIVSDELRNRLSAYENNRIVYKSDLCPKNEGELQTG